MNLKRLLFAAAFSLAGFHALASDVTIGKEDVSKPYLFDAIKDKTLHDAIATMMKGVKLPAWTRQIVKGGNYVTGAPRQVEKPLLGATLYNTCMPHDCFDNQMEILVTADGTRAYGLLKEGGRQRYLGDPDDTVKAILKIAQAQ